MRFAIFPVHLSKVLRLPRKSDARSYKVLHLSRKIIFANLKIWCSKMQPLSGNQRPDLLTSLMNMSLVLRLPRKMHLCRSSSNVPRLPSFLEMLQNPHVLLTFDKVHNPLRLPRETTSERPKVLRARRLFALLTSKCASRHNGVHFLNISTSKSAPNVECVLCIFTSKCASRHNGVHFFDIVRPKVVRTSCVCTFWLRNVLRATTACKFSSLISPDGSAPADTRRFSEPTLRPSAATNHWKNTMNRDFSTFSRTCIFFLLTLSLLWSFLFCSSPLWLFPPLAFPSVHIVGSLTSKLPSINKMLAVLNYPSFPWYIMRI